MTHYEIQVQDISVGAIFRFIIKGMVWTPIPNEVKHWCDFNVKSPYSYDMMETSYGFQIVIYDNVDAMAFKLRWL